MKNKESNEENGDGGGMREKKVWREREGA